MTANKANVADTTRTPAGAVSRQRRAKSILRTTATHDVSKEEGATAMMFTCATPGCTDRRHDHLGESGSRDAPLPRSALPARRAPAKAVRTTTSTKVIRGRKGKSLRIDIHCHYLNQAVAAKVA